MSAALRYALTTGTAEKEMVEARALVCYPSRIVAIYQHYAAFVDRILYGVKPVDLPIEQPTEFELVINLKTAKTLGLTIPQRSCCARTR